MHDRPYRSALYIPGSKDRALDKARGLPVDVILFDLEDAVAPDAKVAARDTLHAALAGGGYGSRLRIVRINGLDTEWGRADAAAVAAMDCDAILLPKVNGTDDVDALAALVPDLPIWAMMETPQGILNAPNIANHPRIAGFVLGTNDLAKDLNSRTRAALHASLQLCVLAARAAGIVVLDGVYNAFKDEDGLRADESLVRYLANGGDPDLITISTDSGGCLASFDADGNPSGLDYGRSDDLVLSLSKSAKQLGLEAALPAFSSNPARLMRFHQKGRLAVGMDADLVLLDNNFGIGSVMALGRWMVREGQPVVCGTFE